MDNKNFNTTDLNKTAGTGSEWQKNGAKEKMSHKVGDAIEHVGDYVGDKISKKAGEKIRNLGDKIEHSQD